MYIAERWCIEKCRHPSKRRGRGSLLVIGDDKTGITRASSSDEPDGDDVGLSDHGKGHDQAAPGSGAYGMHHKRRVIAGSEGRARFDGLCCFEGWCLRCRAQDSVLLSHGVTDCSRSHSLFGGRAWAIQHPS